MGNTNNYCSILNTYNTIGFFNGDIGDERKKIIEKIENLIGTANDLVNPLNIIETNKIFSKLPDTFNMCMYKLCYNNIHKRMPIWEAINGSGSITLLEGRGKKFLIFGELHCDKKSSELCLDSQNPTSPAQLLADLARYTPSFLDIYTEHSEIEYWSTGGKLSGFIGEISSGPSDIYYRENNKSRIERASYFRGFPCMDFEWFHKKTVKKAKDAWKLGICLTSRWHYTDVREMERNEVRVLIFNDKPIPDDILSKDVSTWRKSVKTMINVRRRELVIENKDNYEALWFIRCSGTIEFSLWEGLAGGTGGGGVNRGFSGVNKYQKKISKKIGPKLFIDWIRVNLPDVTLYKMQYFQLVYQKVTIDYLNIKDESIAKKKAMKKIFVSDNYRDTPLVFNLWKLAREIGLKFGKTDHSYDNKDTSVKSFIDLITAYALLLNPSIKKILSLFTRLFPQEIFSETIFNQLWDLIFEQNFLSKSPRTKKELNRSTEKDAILKYNKKAYTEIIMLDVFENKAYYTVLNNISNSKKLGTGKMTNRDATKFNQHSSFNTPFNIIKCFEKLGRLFVKLSVVNMDTYTLARMFKKFTIPKGVHQPKEPETCIGYFGDAHAINITKFLKKLSGVKLIAANENTSLRERERRPFGKYGGDKSCCLELQNFPQPLLWPTGTDKTDFNSKPILTLINKSRKKKKSKCSKGRKNVAPICDSLSGCEWVVGQGCVSKNILNVPNHTIY